MSQQELLSRVVATLSRLDIPYMVTGSLATSLYGQPRSTHDIDVVVELSPGAAHTLAAEFAEPDFYLDPRAIQEAIRSRGMFNLLELTTGEKVDFWMLTDEPFDRARFARRTRVRLGNLELDVSTPEDTIVQKLHWSALAGGSEKQFRDAVSIYQVQQQLDVQYIEHWAGVLGVLELWQRVKAERLD
jgi:hypothetical protein